MAGLSDDEKAKLHELWAKSERDGDDIQVLFKTTKQIGNDVIKNRGILETHNRQLDAFTKDKQGLFKWAMCLLASIIVGAGAALAGFKHFGG